MYSLDERWTEWIDNKVSMLVNRSNMDPVEFGGKSYEEYVLPVFVYR